MSSKTGIEWTDATWNPVTGCAKVSPGCAHCYAEGVALRFWPTQYPHVQTDGKSLATIPVSVAEDWQANGLTRPRAFTDVLCHEDRLDQPLRWRKPRRVFVNSMSDLFHEDVPDAFIDSVFAVMALAGQHTFQCLTKRADRMRSYCVGPNVSHRVAQAMDGVRVDQEHNPVEDWVPVPGWESYEASTHGRVRRDGAILSQTLNPLYDRPSLTLWKSNEPTTVYVHTLVLLAHRGVAPDGTEARHRNGNRRDNRLANLQWASRSENQQDKVRHGSSGGPAKLTREQAVEIRRLRTTGRTQQSIAEQFGVSRSLVSMIENRLVWPDALDWPLPNVWLGVSVENQHFADERIPLLLQTPTAVRFVSYEPALGPVDLASAGGVTYWDDPSAGLSWVIVGGESGAGARPFRVDWARAILAQCKAAGVPAFMKQLGANLVDDDLPGPRIDPATGARTLTVRQVLTIHHHKGGDPAEWPTDLRVREFPEARS